MKEDDQAFFYVRMLGEFSISCGGREIILGRKSTSKFIQLLQLVWLRGKKGVTKEQLTQALYDRSDLSDSNNSVNNLLYQLRKQMVKIGLPKGEYISRVDGVYFPDDQFPVRMDVHEFEKLMDRAEQSVDEREKCSCYEEAFELYRGELLPTICTEIWVMAENLRLKTLFELCVQWLGNYYKKQSDYNALEFLFDRAVHLYPYDNWQICQIEVLLDKGGYKQAMMLYNKMVRRYSDEMGLPPTPEMLECYERISQMTLHFDGELDEIRQKIWEYPGNLANSRGAYYCSFSGFVDICHMVSRNMERSGKSVFLMLCTLVDYEGKLISNQEKLKARSSLLKKAINKSLRKGDAYTQYSNSQFLILLVGTNREDCELVHRRICRKLKEMAGNRAEIEYVVSSLEELQPMAM